MVSINNKDFVFEQEQSLTNLFMNFKLDVSKGVAVAVNGKVIPRTEWSNYKINDNDKLILIRATQGG